MPRVYIPEANALVPLDSIADKSYADIEISRDSNPPALGYVTKDSIGEELIRAVRTVLRGWRYLSTALRKL